MPPTDAIDEIIAAWAAARPDLEFDMLAVFIRLQRTVMTLNKALRQVSTSYGLTSGEMFVLLALRRAVPHQTLRPTDLFRSLLVTSGAISKRIDRLVTNDLVERVAGPEDRRSWRIHLTTAGRGIADEAITRVTSILREFGAHAGLDSADAATDRLLRHLLEAAASLPLRG